MVDIRRIRNDLIALTLMAATVFLAISLFSYDPADPPGQSVYPRNLQVRNLCGPLGARLAHEVRSGLGIGGFVLLLCLVNLDLQIFSRDGGRCGHRIFATVLVLLGVCLGLQLLSPDWGLGPDVGSGGYLGAWSYVLLSPGFTAKGIATLSITALAAGSVILVDWRSISTIGRFMSGPLRVFGWLLAGVASVRSMLPRRRLATMSEVPISAGFDSDSSLSETPDSASNEMLIEDESPPRATKSKAREFRVNPPAVTGTTRAELISRLEESSREHEDYEEFQLPGLDILEGAEEFPYELLAKNARVAAATLERTFEEFGLNIRVVEIDTGPVITQFELELEAGLRLSKVTALADDLAIALRVSSVRVVAPIPGKNTVGVEVPNEKRVMVRLRELIESCPEELEKNRIPLFLGKDVSGHGLVIDMAKMPHLLIAGRTGTGKSVCLNSLILSILMTRSPDDVKMLMIDPKMVELSPYRRVPHLMHPVITDMKKAEAVLAWSVDKMEERYDLLARCGVRHLEGYNQLHRDDILERLELDPESEEAKAVPDKMPYIVIIADEMADMMMTSGKDVEGHIIRLAQKSRAVGIHLVLATQKPTVDVITGLIKSNLPARVSFQVASRTDSRVVLDEMGAERLLGNGDMLFLAPGTSHLTRSQGTFVSDEEVNRVIDFFSDREPDYNQELSQLSTATSSGNSTSGGTRNRDALYDAAIEVVIREGRGSVSLLQRCLGIGYGRGARLIDYMAEDGIVGDYNGSQAREVLYTMEQWEESRAGADAELVES